MNKSQLVDALADRIGDRRTAATAVDALLQIVVDTVRFGDSVSLAGFGVFESRARAARTGRNPRTGETVAVPATTVPAFRPGTGFRAAVAGDGAADSTLTRRPSAATNGAGGDVAGAALDGAVSLPARAKATTLATAPADTSKAKSKKKAKAPLDAKDGKDKRKGKRGKK
jgi:DNA-binding protein HU-beta